MAIELLPLSLPASADASKFQNFGREVKGLHPGKLTPEQFEEIKLALYHVRHVHPWRQSITFSHQLVV